LTSDKFAEGGEDDSLVAITPCGSVICISNAHARVLVAKNIALSTISIPSLANSVHFCGQTCLHFRTAANNQASTARELLATEDTEEGTIKR
jgi:hypothetical protein